MTEIQNVLTSEVNIGEVNFGDIGKGTSRIILPKIQSRTNNKSKTK